MVSFFSVFLRGQVVILYAGVKGFIDRVDVNKVTAYEKAWLSHIKASHKVWYTDRTVVRMILKT